MHMIEILSLDAMIIFIKGCDVIFYLLLIEDGMEGRSDL